MSFKHGVDSIAYSRLAEHESNALAYPWEMPSPVLGRFCVSRRNACKDALPVAAINGT